MSEVSEIQAEAKERVIGLKSAIAPPGPYENDLIDVFERIAALLSSNCLIDKETAEYAAECMSAETRRVEDICERLLDGKIPDKIHQRFKLVKTLRGELSRLSTHKGK